MLKSEILYKYVDVSGIMLVHDSSLSLQRNLLFNVLMLFDDPLPDDLRFVGILTPRLPLNFHQFLCWPCEHEIITVCQP